MNQRDDVAYALGAAFGIVVIAGIAYSVLRAAKSATAGAVAAMVIGGLGVMTVAGQAFADEIEQQRRLDEALDALDVDTDSPPQLLTPSEVRCLNDVGLDEDDIIAALTDTSAAGAEQQINVVNAYAVCAPSAMLSADSLERFRIGYTAGLPGQITTEEARCIVEIAIELPEPADVLVGLDPVVGFETMERCLTEASMDMIMGLGGDAQAFGDDPGLDLLADQCRADDDRACDLLYSTSPQDSDYWVLAEDCDGRGLQSELMCTIGMVDEDGDGYFDDTSSGWADVLLDCTDGDMVACDFAYWHSRPQSEPERTGFTCGERIAVINTSCVERYGVVADD